MSKTTEELKRVMYHFLEANKACMRMGQLPYASLPCLEDALENYLERLRRESLEHEMKTNEYVTEAVMLREGYERFKASVAEKDNEIQELKRLLVDRTDELGTARIGLSDLRKEQTEIQSRLHAVDHAYSVQSTANAVAGDLLRKAMETIRKQQGFIRTLYTSRKARKVRPATLVQTSDEILQKRASGHPQHPEACSYEGLHNRYVKKCPHCGSERP